MQSFIDKARNKSEQERKVIALTISGVVVFIIFILWSTSVASRVSENMDGGALVEASVVENQKASVLDSFKRKVKLLAPKENPFNGFSLGIFEKKIEYKQEDVETTEESVEVVEGDEDLDKLLKDFNASIMNEGRELDAEDTEENPRDL